MFGLILLPDISMIATFGLTFVLIFVVAALLLFVISRPRLSESGVAKPQEVLEREFLESMHHHRTQDG